MVSFSNATYLNNFYFIIQRTNLKRLNLYFNLKYGKNEYLLKYKEYQTKIGILDKRLLENYYKNKGYYEVEITSSNVE